MTWIHQFSNSHIPYYIYKLNKGDSVIHNNHNESFIILYGLIYLMKIFTNQEIIPVGILNTNNIINVKSLSVNTQNYYKLIAFETTYLIHFKLKNMKYNKPIYKSLTFNIINSYELTLVKYEMMQNIIMQKYIKYRFIQLILFLALEFGIIHQTKIIIPFKISQQNIANIIGTNKITINKIIKYLSTKMLIKYSSKKKFIFQTF